MAPSYTTNSGIEKPLDGEQTGSWGDTVNLNMDIIDRSLTGVGSITLSGTTHTLTTTDGTLTDGQYRVLVLGGTPSGTNTITVSPNDQTKLYFVVNNSGQDAVFTQGSGGNVTVANNTNKMIYADGAGAGAAVVDFTDRFAASNIDINGGTIDGTVIGGSSAAAGTFTTFTSTGIDDNATSTAITIDSSENVGVGTTSPTEKLHVNGSVKAGAYFIGTDPSYLYQSATDTITLRVGADGPYMTLGKDLGSSVLGVGNASGQLAFLTGSTERMRIDSSGNVGIGISSPATQLDISNVSRYTFNTSNAYALQTSLNAAGSAFVDDYKNAAQHIWQTSGTERMRIDSSGNVGIGTSTPNAQLGFPIGNDIKISQVAGTGHLAGNVGSLGLTISDGGNHSGVFVNNTHNGTYSSQDITFLTAEGGVSVATERMIIDSSGNVGIGTSSPAVPLHIERASNEMVRLRNTTAGGGSGYISFYETGGSRVAWIGNSSSSNTNLQINNQSASGFVSINTNNTERMRIDSSGNVGIGTTSPLSAAGYSWLTINGASAYGGIVSLSSANTELGRLQSTSSSTTLSTRTAAPLLFNTNTAERMRISSTGDVGIGTSSPAATLDVAGTLVISGGSSVPSGENGIYTTGDGMFIVQNTSQNDDLFLQSQGDITYQTNFDNGTSNADHIFKTGTATEVMRIDGSSGRVGIGTSSPSRALDIVAANNVGGFESTVNDTVANQSLYANLIDYNISGSDTTTADRTHAGLHLDIDSSASGGNTSDEHRIYGIWTDIDVTADSDLVYGTYNTVRTTHSSGTITELRGTYNVVEADGTGTVTNAYGCYNYALSGATVSGLLNGYGSFNKYLKESADTSTVNNAHGVYAEVEIDAGTITSAYGVRSIIDRDGGTVTNGYLYRGEYQGSYSSGTQWGAYISGEEKNYFSNNVGIGTTSPTKQLHITKAARANIGTLTDSATITLNFDSNQNFSFTLRGNRTLANPSNIDEGQTGSIFITQDGTGNRTLSFGSYWKFAGGTAPALSTGANDVDRIDYIVKSSTQIHAVATLNLS